MRRVTSLFLALATVCLGAQGHKSKISPDASITAASQSTFQVIVQWNVPVGTVTSGKITSLGGSVVSEFKSLNQGVYTIPASALSILGADPLVKYVSVNRQVKHKLAFTAAAIHAASAWRAGYFGTGIGVAILDSGINPDDNLGINPSKAIAYTQDFTVATAVQPNGHPATEPAGYGLDWYGHGQHIAGIIASNGKQSICNNCTSTFLGIAPGASLINLKVLDENGQGTDSEVIAAIDTAINLKRTYNIRVMNLSLGRPIYESYTQDPLCQAVEAAWKAGIVVVVAAGNDGRDKSFGNDGYGTITAPGNDPYVITVGAMKTENTFNRSDDLIASYSSKGPTAIDHVVKPDIVAPGNRIVSLLDQHGTLELTYPENAVPLADFQAKAPSVGTIPPQPSVQSTTNTQRPAARFAPGTSNKYFILNGTSMAAAVVSGAAADILQAKPALTPDQVKTLLMMTAYKTFPNSSTVVDAGTGNVYVDYYDLFTVGAGYLDLGAAMLAINQVPNSGPSLSPVASYDPTSGNVTLSYDPASVWGNKALWGTRGLWGTAAVWSSSVLNGNEAVWASDAPWGFDGSDVSSSSGVWGTKGIWGTRGLWGTSTGTSATSFFGTPMDTSEAVAIQGEN